MPILNVNMIKEDNYSDYFTSTADCETDLLNKIITFLSVLEESVIVYTNTKGAYSQKSALRCSYAAFTSSASHTAQAAATKRPTQDAWCEPSVHLWADVSSHSCESRSCPSCQTNKRAAGSSAQSQTRCIRFHRPRRHLQFHSVA